jgi:membrane protein required for colicin V production
VPILNTITTVFQHFNYLDYAFMTLLVIAMLVGGFKGFCRQIVSWFFWIVAAYIAYYYASDLAEYFFSSRLTSPLLRLLLVNFALFVVTLVMSYLFNRIVQALLSLSGLSVFDRFLGVYFGMVQGVVLIAIVVTGFSATGIKNEPWWRHSRVVVMTSALMPLYAEDLVQVVDASLKSLNKLWDKGVGDQFSWQFDSSRDE